MSSGINILFQFPTQCVQTQIQHELKKKKKDVKSQKDFTEAVSHSAEDTVLFQKHGAPLELRFKTQESHWLALQPECLVCPLTAN